MTENEREEEIRRTMRQLVESAALGANYAGPFAVYFETAVQALLDLAAPPSAPDAPDWKARAIAAEDAQDRTEVERDGVYTERTRLVALIAGMCRSMGFACGLGQHDPEDKAWDPEWRTIVFVNIPDGLGQTFQASWHIADRDRGLVEHLPAYEGTWDGHSTTQKYAKLHDAAQYLSNHGLHLPAPQVDPQVLELLADMIEWGSWGDGVPEGLPGFTRAMVGLGVPPDVESFTVPAPLKDLLMRRRAAALEKRKRRAADASATTAAAQILATTGAVVLNPEAIGNPDMNPVVQVSGALADMIRANTGRKPYEPPTVTTTAPPRCATCNGTGVIDTGNNDLPCDCPAGDVAMFNVAGLGRVTGAQLKRER